ncbi:MAG: DUF4276 family protein [Planctomycetes bacterium]|nr:DUF4276 family protein [Planctomycetota bacterium]
MAITLIAPIVEGHGEVEAVPALLYRIAETIGLADSLRVNPPIRVKSGSFLNDADYFERYVTLAAAKAAQAGGSVLILLDCEDGCTKTLGPDLLRKARAVRGDVMFLVVLAKREYESWFLAAARSLRGVAGLKADTDPPADSTAIRGAKEWLTNHMNGTYDEITHQVVFTRKFGFEEARGNPSFDRALQRIRALFRPDSPAAPN